MSKVKQVATTIASILLPAAAQAHPGPHREGLDWSLLHAFAAPDHLLTMASVAAWAAMAVCVAYWFRPWRKDSWSR